MQHGIYSTSLINAVAVTHACEHVSGSLMCVYMWMGVLLEAKIYKNTLLLFEADILCGSVCVLSSVEQLDCKVM